MIEAIGKTYPGRASVAPVLDVFITLLDLGASGYKGLLKQRKDLFKYFKGRLKEVAAANGERLLDTPSNTISLGITLSTLAGEAAECGIEP